MSKIERQRKAFEEMIEGKPMSLATLLQFGVDALFDPLRMLITYMPGGTGYTLRRLYYHHILCQLGKNCLIDVGVSIKGAENVSIGDYCWIDSYCQLSGVLGDITIGRRIHIGSGSILASGGKLELQDYVGVSSGVMIFSNSETPKEGKRMSGPMIPERYKAFVRAPVVIEKDAFIGANSVVLPGVTIGEGAVIGANSVVTKDIPAWSIAVGAPAKVVGSRDKVTVPDI